MVRLKKIDLRMFGMAAALAVSSSVYAGGIPVIDGAHIATAKMNNMEQIAKWVVQLERMKTELEQTKGIWDSLKDGRGMGNILRDDLIRQFLPQDYWAVAEVLVHGGIAPLPLAFLAQHWVLVEFGAGFVLVGLHDVGHPAADAVPVAVSSADRLGDCPV